MTGFNFDANAGFDFEKWETELYGVEPEEVDRAYALTWRFFRLTFEASDRIATERGVAPLTKACDLVRIVDLVAEAHESSGDEGVKTMADRVGLGSVGLVWALDLLGPHVVSAHEADVEFILEAMELPHVRALVDQIETTERDLATRLRFGNGR